MNDLLLWLSSQPAARNAIRQLRLPLPLPQPLARVEGLWSSAPLAEQKVLIVRGTGAQLCDELSATLKGLDAELSWIDLDTKADTLIEGTLLPMPPADELKLDRLVFDASGLRETDQLQELYESFHPLLRRLSPCARVLVLARPAHSAETCEQAAIMEALDGFVRSVAKELGKKGSTAQLLRVARGAEDRIGPTLPFLLSARSAFVSGQPLELDLQAQLPEGVGIDHTLDGKRVLVTGAGRGIGAATAAILAAQGAKVTCLERPEDADLAEGVARELNGDTLLLDVSAEDSPDKIAAHFKATGGPLHAIIHNAGVTRDKTLGRMSLRQWQQVLDINLKAVMRIDAKLLEENVLAEGGRIVCLSSVAGIAGNLGQTNYAASKAGIIGYVRARSAEVAERGITVNAIAPGFIETRMTAAIPALIREAGRRLSNLGQGGQPEDVGQALAFLASPASQGLTGRVLRVCGGALIGA